MSTARISLLVVFIGFAVFSTSDSTPLTKRQSRIRVKQTHKNVKILRAKAKRYLKAFVVQWSKLYAAYQKDMTKSDKTGIIFVRNKLEGFEPKGWLFITPKYKPGAEDFKVKVLGSYRASRSLKLDKEGRNEAEQTRAKLYPALIAYGHADMQVHATATITGTWNKWKVTIASEDVAMISRDLANLTRVPKTDDDKYKNLLEHTLGHMAAVLEKALNDDASWRNVCLPRTK